MILLKYYLKLNKYVFLNTWFLEVLYIDILLNKFAPLGIISRRFLMFKMFKKENNLTITDSSVINFWKHRKQVCENRLAASPELSSEKLATVYQNLVEARNMVKLFEKKV